MKKNGGPAFPIVIPGYYSSQFMPRVAYKGISIRDWMAVEFAKQLLRGKPHFVPWREIPENAYELADRMIKERDKNDSDPEIFESVSEGATPKKKEKKS